jgi:DnaK suppressor protein
MLMERRREMQEQVAHAQGDMDLTVLQMHGDSVRRIDDALVRLDANTYGNCLECGNEIAERRLRALTFAMRCQACEHRREQQQCGAEQLALRRGRLSLFSDGVGY